MLLQHIIKLSMIFITLGLITSYGFKLPAKQTNESHSGYKQDLYHFNTSNFGTDYVLNDMQTLEVIYDPVEEEKFKENFSHRIYENLKDNFVQKIIENQYANMPVMTRNENIPFMAQNQHPDHIKQRRNKRNTKNNDIWAICDPERIEEKTKSATCKKLLEVYFKESRDLEHMISKAPSYLIKTNYWAPGDNLTNKYFSEIPDTCFVDENLKPFHDNVLKVTMPIGFCDSYHNHNSLIFIFGRNLHKEDENLLKEYLQVTDVMPLGKILFTLRLLPLVDNYKQEQKFTKISEEQCTDIVKRYNATSMPKNQYECQFTEPISFRNQNPPIHIKLDTNETHILAKIRFKDESKKRLKNDMRALNILEIQKFMCKQQLTHTYESEYVYYLPQKNRYDVEIEMIGIFTKLKKWLLLNWLETGDLSIAIKDHEILKPIHTVMFSRKIEYNMPEKQTMYYNQTSFINKHMNIKYAGMLMSYDDLNSGKKLVPKENMDLSKETLFYNYVNDKNLTISFYSLTSINTEHDKEVQQYGQDDLVQYLRKKRNDNLNMIEKNDNNSTTERFGKRNDINKQDTKSGVNLNFDHEPRESLRLDNKQTDEDKNYHDNQNKTESGEIGNKGFDNGRQNNNTGISNKDIGAVTDVSNENKEDDMNNVIISKVNNSDVLYKKDEVTVNIPAVTTPIDTKPITLPVLDTEKFSLLNLQDKINTEKHAEILGKTTEIMPISDNISFEKPTSESPKNTTLAFGDQFKDVLSTVAPNNTTESPSNIIPSTTTVVTTGVSKDKNSDTLQDIIKNGSNIDQTNFHRSGPIFALSNTTTVHGTISGLNSATSKAAGSRHNLQENKQTNSTNAPIVPNKQQPTEEETTVQPINSSNPVINPKMRENNSSANNPETIILSKNSTSTTEATVSASQTYRVTYRIEPHDFLSTPLTNQIQNLQAGLTSILIYCMIILVTATTTVLVQLGLNA